MKRRPSKPKAAAAPMPRGHAPDRLAQIRHDLRTPVVHVLGYSELLQEVAEDRGLDQFIPDLKKIQIAGKNLVNLINELLSPARVEAKEIDLRHIHSELRTPLNHITGYCEILQELAEETKQTDLLPDLQKIHLASRNFLTLIETLLVPASFSETGPPREAAHFERQQVAPAPRRMRGPVPRERGAILVVDDDEGNRDVLNRRLSRQGYEVTTAESGPQALRLLRKTKFDLVLLDLIMPVMDGDQVLAKIKSDPQLRHVPVIMLSAVDELDSVVRCILMGAEDYLSKPYNPVLLQARIGACLERQRLREQEQAHLKQIQDEQAKSEGLLLNILPKPIADRLKLGENTIVDSLPEVTVLFADLVGFTELAARISSEEMVRLLDDIFSTFDRLAQEQGLEKIKTIGDAYMVVGGLPTPRADHATAIAELALNMQAAVRDFFSGYKTPIRIRIGINSGPVVAGIIGRHKFAYDLWGDTVNIASRMESHGQPGRIQVSEATYARLRDKYEFADRGRIEIKGKGVMATYFLEGRKC